MIEDKIEYRDRVDEHKRSTHIHPLHLQCTDRNNGEGTDMLQQMISYITTKMTADLMHQGRKVVSMTKMEGLNITARDIQLRRHYNE